MRPKLLSNLSPSSVVPCGGNIFMCVALPPILFFGMGVLHECLAEGLRREKDGVDKGSRVSEFVAPAWLQYEGVYYRIVWGSFGM